MRTVPHVPAHIVETPHLGATAAEIEFSKAKGAAERARTATLAWGVGKTHPLAWTICNAWAAGQNVVAAARTLPAKTAALRALEARMHDFGKLHGAALAEAVEVQEAEIAAIRTKGLAAAPPPPPPPTAADVLAAYRSHGCGFVLDGDTLRLTNAADLLPGDLARLREFKPEIIALLRAETIEV